MLELIIACAALALLEMDTTYLGQFLFSRPACTGAIMGYICGDFFLGLQLGVFTELLFIDFVPVGGFVPPSGAICAGIGVILSTYFNMDIYFSFFIGLILSLLFAFVEKALRKYRSKLLPSIEKQLIEGSLTPSSLIAQSFLVEYMAVFIFVLIMITLFGPAFCYIDGNIPKSLHIAFKFSYFLVPWIGLSMLFISFSTKPKVD
ncbi:MAG: PTS sugar transporter subunit IIC [Elusimicrobiaceae bacterium]|nr:PTS sugar transporter subunit IIC [Elusimicrobiaceae bacterium]